MNQHKIRTCPWVLTVYGKATELLYHSFAWAYDLVAWLVSFGEWTQWRRDSLDYLQPGPTLEVGFGTGELLLEMSRLGLDVVGLELSSEMHRVTARKLNRYGFSVWRVQSQSEAIPFTENTFNNIIVTFPSNYIARPETLRAFFRILKGEGRVIVAGLSVKFTARLKHRLTAWFLDDSGKYFISHLADEAEKAGFQAAVVSHGGKDYIQPILLLEKPDEN